MADVHRPAARNSRVSTIAIAITDTSGLVLMETAGFNIMTNGSARYRPIFGTPRAMPLKNPATPIPRDIHMFSKREAMKSMKDNTGIAVIKA